MQRALLFIHILGVAGLLMGIGAKFAVFHNMRVAKNPVELRSALRLAPVVGRVIPVSVVVLVAAGLAMVSTNNNFSFASGWVIISLVLTAAMSVAGPVFDERIKAIADGAAKARGKVIPADLQAKVSDPQLQAGNLVGVMILAVLLFLMAVKPVWLVSFLVTAVSLGVTGAFALYAYILKPATKGSELGEPIEAIAPEVELET